MPSDFVPLPIAVLLRRVRNAKSAPERHLVAYHAWEASVRLAVAARPPADVSGLTTPSVGAFVTAVEWPASELEDELLLDAFELWSSKGQGVNARPRRVAAARLLAALPAYRNRMIGHGAAASDAFYADAGQVMAAAIERAWQCGLFWPSGSRLVLVDRVEVGPDGVARPRVLDVSGLGSFVDEALGRSLEGARVVPGQLYLHRLEQVSPLYPWLLYQALDEVQGERVLFYDKLRKGPEYLDYVSGDWLRARDLSDSHPSLDRDVKARFDTGPRLTSEVQQPEPDNAFGDFEIVGMLGQGGMGIVHVALQRSLGRHVALKKLPAEVGVDEIAVARFRREAGALARCEHPNIVKVLSSGVVGGQPYYAMELIQGVDLAAVMRRHGAAQSFHEAVDAALDHVTETARAAKIDPRILVGQSRARADGGSDVAQLCALFRDAARGVHYLHDQGIIHRDLKPGNLMLTAADRRLVVMDLGLAAVENASRSITRERSAVVGTLRYMPPEQFDRSRGAVDRRADVYALGVTFFELLARRPLFDADSDAAVMREVLSDESVDVRARVPALPRDLASILSKAIEKDRDRRYSTAAQLADDLDNFLEGRPVTARPATFAYVAGKAIRRNKLLTALAALLVAVLAGSSWAYLHTERALVQQFRAANAKLLEEQGRVELRADQPSRALAHLIAAHEGDERPLRPESVPEFVPALRASMLDESTLKQPHKGGVRAVAFSPSGERLLTAGEDNHAVAWDLIGSRAGEGAGKNERIEAVCVHSSGFRVATVGEDGTARIRTPNGGLIAVLGSAAPLAGSERAVQMSRDCETAAITTSAGAWEVWRIDTARKLATVAPATWQLDHPFSPDGSAVGLGVDEPGLFGATLGRRALRIVDVHTGEVLGTVVGPRPEAELAPRGSFVAERSSNGGWGDRPAVLRWSVLVGLPMPPLECENGGDVSAFDFDPHANRVVVGCGTRWLSWAEMRELDTGVLLWSTPSAGGSVTTVRFDLAGDAFAVGRSGGIVEVHAPQGGTGTLLAPLDGPVTELQFSPDGRALATVDRKTRLWRLSDGALRAVVPGAKRPRFAFDGRTLAAVADRRAEFIDVGSGATLRTITQDRILESVGLSWAGDLAVTRDEALGFTIWNPRTGIVDAELGTTLHPERILGMAFAGEEAVFASASAGALLLDSPSGRSTVALTDADGVVFSDRGGLMFAWSKNGGGAVTTVDGREACRLPTGKIASAVFVGVEVRALVVAWADGQVTSSAIDATQPSWSCAPPRKLDIRSEDGASLIAFSSRAVLRRKDGSATLFDPTGATAAVELEGAPISQLASKGGAIVWHGTRVDEAGTSRGTVYLQRTSESGPHPVVDVSEGSLTALAVDSGGRHVALGLDDGRVQLFDSSGPLIATFAHHLRRVRHLAFSEDGERLASAGEEGDVHVWSVRPVTHLEVQGDRSGRIDADEAMLSADGVAAIVRGGRASFRRVGPAEDGAANNVTELGTTIQLLPSHRWGDSGGARWREQTADYVAVIPVLTRGTAAALHLTDPVHIVTLRETSPSAEVAVSNDGTLALVADSTGVDLFNTVSGVRLRHLADADGEPAHVAFAMEGSTAIVTIGTVVRIFSANDLVEPPVIVGAIDPVGAVAANPGGSTFVTIPAQADGRVFVWDTQGTFIQSLGRFADPVTSAIVHESQALLVTKTGAAWFWRNGTAAATRLDPGAPVFSADTAGKVLALGTCGNGVQLYDFEDGKPLGSLGVRTRGCVSVSAAGGTLLTLDADEGVHAWQPLGEDLPSADLRAISEKLPWRVDQGRLVSK